PGRRQARQPRRAARRMHSLQGRQRPGMGPDRSEVGGVRHEAVPVVQPRPVPRSQSPGPGPSARQTVCFLHVIFCGEKTGLRPTPPVEVLKWLKAPGNPAILIRPMLKRMCTSKIANAFITKAELHYEGSCGIDASVLEAAGILPYEMVLIANVTNGRRFETYTIPEARGSGAFCLYRGPGPTRAPGHPVSPR